MNLFQVESTQGISNESQYYKLTEAVDTDQNADFFTDQPAIMPSFSIGITSAEESIFILNKEQIEILGQIYLFLNPTQIRSFLFNHLFLIDILSEAYEQVRNLFGDKPQLCLELCEDPEEDFTELFLVIKSKKAPEENLDLLDKLDETWFLKVMDKTRGLFNITVESNKPVWEQIVDIGKRIPESEWGKIPTDLAENLDNYLYGTFPKK